MSEHVDTLNRMLQRCDEHEAPALQAAIRALANTEIRIPAGTLISVDVSEGDDDAENRVFARATGEVMPYHEPVILSIEEERNFDQGQGTPASHNPPTLPVVGTIAAQDCGPESMEHRIELDKHFDESLSRLPADTKVTLYASPDIDLALRHLRDAAALVNAAIAAGSPAPRPSGA